MYILRFSFSMSSSSPWLTYQQVVSQSCQHFSRLQLLNQIGTNLRMSRDGEIQMLALMVEWLVCCPPISKHQVLIPAAEKLFISSNGLNRMSVMELATPFSSA